MEFASDAGASALSEQRPCLSGGEPRRLRFGDDQGRSVVNEGVSFEAADEADSKSGTVASTQDVGRGAIADDGEVPTFVEDIPEARRPDAVFAITAEAVKPTVGAGREGAAVCAGGKCGRASVALKVTAGLAFEEVQMPVQVFAGWGIEHGDVAFGEPDAPEVRFDVSGPERSVFGQGQYRDGAAFQGAVAALPNLVAGDDSREGAFVGSGEFGDEVLAFDGAVVWLRRARMPFDGCAAQGETWAFSAEHEHAFVEAGSCEEQCDGAARQGLKGPTPAEECVVVMGKGEGAVREDCARTGVHPAVVVELGKGGKNGVPGGVEAADVVDVWVVVAAIAFVASGAPVVWAVVAGVAGGIAGTGGSSVGRCDAGGRFGDGG